ncbi:NAD(P)-binding protein [Microthyrium microscopicum]|uniref:NAD(P)-binding protein n=1 Tax=Microthyrium microscopicum TaxID=703497 RepID=A0A6A6U1M1_9PEZI|nr:NAD(P)-binding protein [Microthyrium microscopicum]
MSAGLVLITGATGLIGYSVVVEALRSGYSVRAAVRSQAKADRILATKPIKELWSSNPVANLSFVFVPDILADGAYDEAVQGVQFVIHLASPVPNQNLIEDFETQLIQPAVKGTTGILTSALKTTGIKRIVITSSTGGIVSFHDLIGFGTGKTFDGDHRVPADNGPYAHVMQAYAASKVKALLATDEFFANNKTEFDHVNIMPSFVLGRNDLATTPEEIASSSNGVLMRLVLGHDAPMPLPGTTVHLEDVAKMHVLSLDSAKVAGGSNFVATSGGLEGIQFNDYQEIVNRRFPSTIENGRLPNNGTLTTKSLKLDASKAETVFGFKFQGYEEQVVSVVRQYLEILGSS